MNVNSMNVGLLEAKPAWFELLLSPNGWLEGDVSCTPHIAIHYYIVCICGNTCFMTAY